MKKLYILFIAIIAIHFTNIYAQQTIPSQKVLSGYGYGTSMIKDTISGNITITGTYFGKVCAIKFNSEGTIIKKNTFMSGAGSCIKQTSDKGFIITGSTNAVINSTQAICLIKIDSNLNAVWQKTVTSNGSGTNAYCYGNSVIVEPDGYIVLGDAQGFSCSYEGMFIFKTDLLGNIIWSNVYGQQTYGMSIIKTIDGGIIACGNMTYNGSNLLLMKTDNLGNEMWLKKYRHNDNDTGEETGTVVTQTQDSNFLIIGITSNGNHNSNKGGIYVVKVDQNGDTLWTRAINSNSYSEYGTSVVEVNDGYVITGYSKDTNQTMSNILLVKLQKDGSVLWGRTIGQIISISGMSYGNAVISDNRNFKIIGNTSDGQIYLINTDSIGNAGGCYDSTASFVSTPTQSIVNSTTIPQYSVTPVLGSSSVVAIPDFNFDTICMQGIYSLIYLTDNNGYILGTDPQKVAKDSNGTMVTAVPYQDYQFLKWSDGVTTASRIDSNIQGPIVVTAMFVSTLSVPEIGGDKFIIYPNPTKDNLTIETNINKEQKLEIINLFGQTVYASNINKKVIINTSAFANGVYILKLSSDKEAVVRKFIKQ